MQVFDSAVGIRGCMKVRRAAVVACALVASVGCASTAPPNAQAAALPAAEQLNVPLRPLEPAEDYRLGAPDRLALEIFDLEKPGTITKLEIEVSAQGDVLVPYAGAIKARGKTISELKAAIESALSRVLVEPQVTVCVKEYRSHQVAVMGAVDKPGVFYLTHNRVTLVEALSLAGGLLKESPTSTGAGTRVLIFPARVAPAIEQPASVVTTASTPIEIDLVKLLARGGTSLDIWVESGSIVQVPQAEEFFVQGYVNRAGSFPYRRPTTALQAISVAGGFDERHASRSCVRIKRPTRGGGVEIIDVDGKAVADGEEPDVAIFAGDSIDVGRTVPWAIYSEFVEGFKGLVGFGLTGGIP
jgi:polysaccharide export outer membrane protein